MEPTRLRPLQVGEILDTAIQVYRSRLLDLMKVVAIMVAPVQILSVLVNMSVPTEDLSQTDEFGNLTVDGGDVAGTFAAYMAVGLLSYLAVHLATAGSIKIVSDSYLGEQRPWKESLRFAVDRFGSLVWLLIIFWALVILGTIACILPGVYFYVAWAVAVPVLMLEDRKGFKALSRSRALVEGTWWRTFGLLIMTGILTSIIGGILGAIFGGVFLAMGNETLSYVGQGIGNLLSQLLVTPFSAAVVAVLYFDLRVRKEGFDLELLARSVGVDVPEGLEAPSWGRDEPSGPHGGDAKPPFWPPPPGWRPPPSV